MKLLAAALLGSAMLIAAPALAQDKNDMSGMDMHAKDAMPDHHPVARHRERYKRDYKTDAEEERETADLNRQYRGVPSDH